MFTMLPESSRKCTGVSSIFAVRKYFGPVMFAIRNVIAVPWVSGIFCGATCGLGCSVEHRCTFVIVSFSMISAAGSYVMLSAVYCIGGAGCTEGIGCCGGLHDCATGCACKCGIEP